ncbi:MAG: aldehyde ferredoxin oxidoreductase C-terminal domain-containing protein, partial [Pseudonocardiaceae bacterium]
VNARGADHNRSGAYEADLSGDYDRLAGGDAQVVAAVATEDRAAVMDSMILCKFLRGVFDEPFREWAELLTVVTGWDVDAAELRATARRIALAKRMFNLRTRTTELITNLRSRPIPEIARLGRTLHAWRDERIREDHSPTRIRTRRPRFVA